MSETRRWCTVPSIWKFREWYEERFGCDCCKLHDEMYIDWRRASRKNEKSEFSRFEADNIFFMCMIKKGYKYIPIALASYFYLRVLYHPYKLLKAVFDGLVYTVKSVIEEAKYIIR